MDNSLKIIRTQLNNTHSTYTSSNVKNSLYVCICKVRVMGYIVKARIVDRVCPVITLYTG